MRLEFPLPATLLRVLEVMREHSKIRDAQIEVGNIPPSPGYLEIAVKAAGFIEVDDARVWIYAGGGCIDTNYLVGAGPAFSLAETIAATNGVELVEADSAGHGDFCVTLPFDSRKEQIRRALDKVITSIVSYMSQVKALDLRLNEGDIHVESVIDICGVV